MVGTGIEDQLDRLRDKILLLGGSVESAVERAIRSLTERDTELANRVLAEDNIIDQMELQIDRLSVEILGSHRPTEHDLRLVVSVAKITPILERIADHAASVAEAATILNNEPQISSYIDYSLMAETAAGMLREALDAFTSEDAEASREIIRRDRKIDDCYHKVFGELVQLAEPGLEHEFRGRRLRSVLHGVHEERFGTLKLRRHQPLTTGMAHDYPVVGTSGQLLRRSPTR